MPFPLTVTNAGRAALVNAAKDGTNAVRIASVGVSATALAATAATTALPGEIKRIGTISGDAVAPDTIHVTVRDESNGVYSVRSIALYLADGTLFAAYGQSDVLVEKSAQAMLLMALDVRFADIAATSLTFGATDFLNPPATAETQGVVELATDAEASAGTDDRRAVTPKGLSFAMSARFSAWGADIWRASNDGAGSGLDADLLDGQQGSYYANIPGRLGYTPANKAGDVFTGLVTVQSSGLNAGLRLLNPNGGRDYRVLQKDAGIFAITDETSASERFSIQPNGMVLINTGVAWHAANDGAGSGLDADLLDGRESSYFAPINSPTFSGNIATFADGRLLVQHDGSDAYIRPLNGGSSMWLGSGNANIMQITSSGLVKITGFTVWHAGNDGAGSGLDADLLDGQDSSFYTNIVARLGYMPANRGGDTFTGLLSVQGTGLNAGLRLFNINGGRDYRVLQKDGGSFAITDETSSNERITITANGTVLFNASSLAWHAGNDGAGSGLDADLLDGLDSSFYTNIAARLGYTPVQQGTGVGHLSNIVKVGWSGSRVKVTIDATDMGNVVFDNHIADVWRVSNDGAGSGLDADLLDGRHASDFALNASLGDVWRSSNDGAGSGLDADLLDGRQASDFVLQNDGARFGSNGNGYWERRPNGVIEQWGTLSGPFSEGQQFVTFPIPFTNVDSVNISATGVNAFANNRYDITIQRVSRSADGCSLMVQYTAAASSINQIDAIDWRAVGI